MAGLSGAPVQSQAADLDYVPGPVPPEGGAPCVFENWGPVIPYAWPSVWLGHFAGGRFTEDAYGHPVLDWHNEKVCFSSHASCRHWIAENHRALHNPEGDQGCVFIR